MRLMSFGACSASIHLQTDAWAALARFIQRATSEAPPGCDDMELVVAVGGQPSLAVSHAGDRARLTIASGRLAAPDSVLQIAVLQAAARCLSLRTAATGAVLLHGSAVTTLADNGAVAVLDGGRGQGKTSLAVGLAQMGGSLIVDEFLFADVRHGLLEVSPAPFLPWHLRDDMRPRLLPNGTRASLLFPEDMPQPHCARSASELRAVLVPDMASPAGHSELLAPDVARRHLQHAVTDHRAKLVDPRLDHVSIFTSARQITTASGSPLGSHYHRLSNYDSHTLNALCQLPVFLVGIGEPAAIRASVDGALRALEAIQWPA